MYVVVHALFDLFLTYDLQELIIIDFLIGFMKEKKSIKIIEKSIRKRLEVLTDCT